MKIEMATFFYENYPTAKENISFQDCLNMMDKFNVFYVKNEFIALYLNINDYIFDIINNNPNVMKEELFIRECFLNKGENVHFFYCVGKGINNILKGIRSVKIKEYTKTISWYRDDMKKLHIRRYLCQSHC